MLSKIFPQLSLSKYFRLIYIGRILILKSPYELNCLAYSALIQADFKGSLIHLDLLFGVIDANFILAVNYILEDIVKVTKLL